MLSTTLFLLVVFAIVVGVTSLVVAQFAKNPVERRLHALATTGAAPVGTTARSDWTEALARRLAPLARPAQPRETPEAGAFRMRFWVAGIRSPAAPVIYFASKTLLTFLLPAAFLVYIGISSARVPSASMLLLVLLFAAVGYYLPNAVLAALIQRRQNELFLVFPDALDLMRVCVESGLSLDAAIERVGQEVRFESAALSDELHMVSLELRAGAGRADALRNLALRIGLEDVDALVSILVQADRFGTSVSEALRVHSDTLRTKRRLRAEERAAKLPVKLLLPLVFCIFPSMLTVLLGPAFIAIYRTLMPLLGSH